MQLFYVNHLKGKVRRLFVLDLPNTQRGWTQAVCVAALLARQPMPATVRARRKKAFHWRVLVKPGAELFLTFDDSAAAPLPMPKLWAKVVRQTKRDRAPVGPPHRIARKDR
jgi:hypothetical protein